MYLYSVTYEIIYSNLPTQPGHFCWCIMAIIPWSYVLGIQGLYLSDFYLMTDLPYQFFILLICHSLWTNYYKYNEMYRT